MSRSRHRCVSSTRAIAVFLTATLLGPSAFAIPPPPIPDAPPGAATYLPEQLEKTPARDLARQLLSDWARGFVEKRTNEGLTFYTRPSAGYAGVCAVTRLRVVMATPTKAPVGAPSYISGDVAIERLYHLVDLKAPFDPTHVAPILATVPLCDALPPGSQYFPAPSALVAAYQHHLIDDAVMQAEGSGKLNFELDCIRGAGTDCDARKMLSTLHASDIRGIVARNCPEYSRHECYEIALDGWYLEVESAWSTYGYSMVEPDRILVSIGLSKLPHDLAVICKDCK